MEFSSRPTALYETFMRSFTNVRKRCWDDVESEIHIALVALC